MLDSCNGVLYADDRQVVSLSAAKLYDDAGERGGRVDIRVERVEGGEVEGEVEGWWT